MNLRKEARGRMCTIRLPGYGNHNPGTDVLCHLNGGGMGMKRNDLAAAYGCSNCHDIVDGRLRSHYTTEKIMLMHMQGVIRTQDILIKEGKIKW